MAEALIRGLVRGGHIPGDRVLASARRRDRLDELRAAYGIGTTLDNREVARGAEIVVLSVKPQILLKVLREVADQIRPGALVISIAAGVDTETIEEALAESVRVVRAMPNVPATVGAGATAIAAGRRAGEADLDTARAIFDAVGITVALDESHLDAVTGLSGSGPAYIFLILEALADAGVKVGLSRRDRPTLTPASASASSTRKT